jgi:hypothetical protein
VEILSCLAKEELKQLVWCIKVASLLSFRSDFSKDSIEFIFWEKLRNPTRRKNIVDINEELIIGNLTISKNEKDLCSLDTGL